MPLTASYVPSQADIERYRRLRPQAVQLNHKIVKTIPREAMLETGDAIGILHQGKLVFATEDETGVLFADPHRTALVFVRTLLEHGTSEHIKYQIWGEDGAEVDEHGSSQTVTASAPGRNSPCPCGSGKRYKRCCGGKG